jgi:drug/metabolite transporter (DMT)-like permease
MNLFLVALVRTLDCIVCFILQYIFIGVTPDLFSIVGSGIVIFAVFLTALKKYLLDLPPTHRTRATFFFLLK